MLTLSTQRIKAHDTLNAMYFNIVNTSVCGFATLYPVYSVYMASHPLGERLIIAICPVGLAVHQSKEAALLTFWYLSNYNGSCRQDTQLTPNS